MAVCVALMAVIASVSGLNVAQSQVAVELGASQSTVLWIINAYTVTLAALLLPLGAAGDRWGRKPMLLTGLAVFAVANVVAVAAPSVEVLLLARVLSGVGAAVIMPITLAVITSTFPEEERAKGIGVWTAVGGGGGILGMFLSAALVDLGSWRLLFVLPLALVAIAFVVARRAVPDSRERPEHGFDAVGSLASAVGIVGLVTALHEGPVHGWLAPLTVAGAGAGVVGIGVFAAWQLRRRGPLLDLRMFRSRALSSGSLSLLGVFGVQAGILVVLFPYFQAVLGWSGLVSTLGFMPMAILMMASAGLAPRLSAGVGLRSTMLGGILMFAGGLASLALMASADGGYLSVLPGMLIMGVGMGLAMTPATEAITGALPRAQQGVASALNDVTRELGTAMGVALLGAVLSAGYRSAIEPRLEGIPADTADAAREGIANAIAAAHGAGAAADSLVRIAQESFVSGWQQAMWAGVAVMVLLFVYVALRGVGPRPARRG
ncbi:EmrB/QacA subfamily drug resistance transporter [Diaminobutyricimonas aerilata]|uniref:EmrB/QacA subfamily drug resistance transporter n=2 Tax=Diaminobutyricimonas aerilata TaxID=1162967 RepID=A0A2M9CP11_9MICO|nr:EmrB/QacA subfamily drug resistance transporter [Diaminobutyricimonas aerilata]